MITYDPEMYERQGLTFASSILDKTLHVNVRWGSLDKAPANRPEVDGIADMSEYLLAVEVKSFPLTADDLSSLIDGYVSMGVLDLLVVAPEMPARSSASNNLRHLRLETFKPDLDEIWSWYSCWMPELPIGVADSLESGRHSFHYVLSAGRNRRGRHVANQVSKRIASIGALKRDLGRLAYPPAKVLWSTNQWTTPKDLYFRNSKPIAIGGLYVLDFDGPKLHNAWSDCQLHFRDRRCPECRIAALIECRKALEVVRGIDLHGSVGIFDSGNRGCHLYCARTTTPLELLSILHSAGVQFDPETLTNEKSFVAFPCSLNAQTLLPLEEISIDVIGRDRSPSGEQQTTVAEETRPLHDQCALVDKHGCNGASEWDAMHEMRGSADDVVTMRVAPDTNIDQCHVSVDSLIRRVRLLLELRDPTRSRYAFVGDDDLASLLLLKVARPQYVYVLDVDPRIISTIAGQAVSKSVLETEEAEVTQVGADMEWLRRRAGSFDVVVMDPPYAEDGMVAFIGLGAGLLKVGGHLLLAVPLMAGSKWSEDLTLAVQKQLAALDLMVETSIPDFASYEGTNIISSALVCRKMAQVSLREWAEYMESARTGRFYTRRTNVKGVVGALRSGRDMS